MKRNAVIRIVIYSLVIVILLGLLAAGMGARMYVFSLDLDTGKYEQGSTSIPAQQLRNIEIEWASGNITIETADTDTITFQETGGTNAEPMVYRQNGDKLTIKYQQPKVIVGFTSSARKDLVITVPQDWVCSELSVDAASADLTVSSLTIGKVELNCASGSCDLTDCTVDELNLDCASGEIYFSGSLNSLDCDAASANVTALLRNVPNSIDFDGASGDLDMTLPANSGFSVTMDSLSGNFSSDFETYRKGGRYVCGTGACEIEVDGVSGDVIIRKGEAVDPLPTIPAP